MKYFWIQSIIIKRINTNFKIFLCNWLVILKKTFLFNRFENQWPLLENVNKLSARSAASARAKFLFINLLIYFILGRGGWPDSDIKSTLPKSKFSYARYYYKLIFTASITKFWAREGRFYVRIWPASPP